MGKFVLAENPGAYEMLKPGLLQFQYEFRDKMGRMPALSEIEDLYTIYFDEDARLREELESARLEKIKTLAPWALDYKTEDKGETSIFKNIFFSKRSRKPVYIIYFPGL